MALKYPSRVLSLTAISTSPVGIDTSHLPGTSEAYMKHSAEGADVDWSSRDQVVEFIVKDAQAIAGTAHPFDEERTRSFVEQDYDRSGGLLSATNHFLLKGGEGRKGDLQELKVPLLVIHGTADPIFPVEHGAAFAEIVAGAKLVRLEGGGHELHPDDWATIVAVLAAHCRSR